MLAVTPTIAVDPMTRNRQSRIGIVVQARMSSRRLPGKVLMRIGTRTLLGQLVEGCRRVADVQGLCVATSDHASDDPIALHCAHLQVDCHRGPLDDVAARFIAAATERAFDAIVRVSGDSPLIDPRLIEHLISRYRESEGCELASNVLRRTYPSGMSVEVISTSALARAYPAMDAEEREHVTPYFYAHPEEFRIVSVEREQPLPGGKFSVDTLDDFRRISVLVARLERPPWEYGLDQLSELMADVSSEVAR
jgi:spore coat polysaccharide biosynthesis protein SpsF (cytidylyltransferase family)